MEALKELGDFKMNITHIPNALKKTFHLDHELLLTSHCQTKPIVNFKCYLKINTLKFINVSTSTR
jgi:hypothetical protein